VEETLELTPIVSQLPAPLDALPDAPLPADGSAVIRMTLNTYEFELAPLRNGVAWAYGAPDRPDVVYASIWDASVEDDHKVHADPRLIELWKRTGFYRPEQVYLPITPDEEALVLGRYAAASEEPGGRQAAWAHWREIRERCQGSDVTRLESSAVSDDPDDIFELYQVVDGTHLRQLAFLSYDQIAPFATAEERERSAAEAAERAAAAAAGTPPDPGQLPF
jgi:hypothetical protein